MEISKIVFYILLIIGIFCFIKIVYCRIIKSTSVYFKIIGISLFTVLIIVFLMWYLYLFYDDRNRQNIDLPQHGYRPEDWQERLKILSKEEDSLQNDLGTVDSVLVVLKRNEVKNYFKIKKLENKYLSDSMTLINVTGAEYDLKNPGH